MHLKSRHEKAYSNAIVALVRNHPFYARLALNLKAMPVNSDEVKNTVTDGSSFKYNADKWISASHDLRVSAIAHQALTCGLLHPFRMGQRDKQDWNAASDYVVNQILEDGGFLIPNDALLNPEFKGLSVEQVYDRIHREQSGSSGGSSSSKTGSGDDESGEGDGSAESESRSDRSSGSSDGDYDDTLFGKFEAAESGESTSDQETEWQQSMVQAVQLEKSFGGTPQGIIEQELQKLLNPRQPWEEILQSYMQSIAQDDYSWQKPDRRFAHMGLIIPTLHSEGLGNIVLGLDVSGSMSERDLRHAAAEINYVKSQLGADAVYVVQVAGYTTHVDVYEGNDLIDVNGFTLDRDVGCDYEARPLFDWIREECPVKPDVVLFFTDMCQSFPDESEAPDCPLIWCSTHRKEMPKSCGYGEFVYVGN